MFHSRVIGAHSANLDLFFFSPNTLKFLLARNSRDCDVSIVEGVMGFYDGLSLTSTRASTYAVARETGSPVVLAVNARGSGLFGAGYHPGLSGTGTGKRHPGRDSESVQPHELPRPGPGHPGAVRGAGDPSGIHAAHEGMRAGKAGIWGWSPPRRWRT